MEKSLYAAPQGLQDAAEQEQAIEIEIIDPEQVTIGLDGLEIEITPDEPEAEDFDANLAEFMSDTELAGLAGDLIADFEKDNADRREWAQTYVEGIKLLGLKYEERTEPLGWRMRCLPPYAGRSGGLIPERGHHRDLPRRGPGQSTGHRQRHPAEGGCRAARS